MTASAVVTDDGPGTAVTGTPASAAARDQPVPGVGHARHPRVGDEGDGAARRIRSSSAAPAPVSLASK